MRGSTHFKYGSGGGVDADYQAVLNFASANAISIPDAPQQAIDNQLLIDYKSTGAWEKDDVFTKFTGTASPAFKLICWKRLILMDAYGGIAWSETGAKGNGTNAFINTKFIPDVNSNFKLNDAGILLRKNIVSSNDNYVDVGAFDSASSTIRDVIFGVNKYFGLNAKYVSNTINNLQGGVNALYRISAAQVLIKSGSLEQSFSNPSGDIVIKPLYLMALNRGQTDGGNTGVPLYSPQEYQFLTIGGSKEAEHEAIKNVLS